MEREIYIIPESIDKIHVEEVSNEEGFILMYNQSKEIIGTVIFDACNDEWILTTVDEQEKENILENLLLLFPNYTYKFIT